MVQIFLENVEEFELARRVPSSAITDVIRDNVKGLDERTQIEPFLREIIYDKTITPHTATERADILTTHITCRGSRKLTAFINKGRSTKKVTLNCISGQIYKASSIPGVQLLVLLAVGEIQDEAESNFIQSSMHVHADYLIVDVVDLARLFIAYRKICPNDGHPFDRGKCPQCGVYQEQPIELTLKVYETPWFEIASQSDVSFGVVRRYSADIVTDAHFSKSDVHEIIRTATWQLRKSTFHRKTGTKGAFSGKDADVVWLYIYYRPFDMQQRNWACRSQWCSAELPKSVTPPDLADPIWLDDIQVIWKADYESWRAFLLKQQTPKEHWMETVESLLPQIDIVRRGILKALENSRESAPEGAVRNTMQQLELTVRQIISEADTRGLPQMDCVACDRVLQMALGNLHNATVPFADGGQAKWEYRTRVWLSIRAFTRHEADWSDFISEWQKLTRA